MRLGIVFGALGIGLASCALALVPLALGKRNRATLPALFDGTTGVYAVPIAGGRPHEVLRLHGQWGFPVATRDGKALLLERPDSARTTLWRVPLNGDAPVRVRTLGVFTRPLVRNGGYAATEKQTRPASGWRIDLFVRDARGAVVWQRPMPFPLATVSAAPDGRRVAVVRMHRLELVTRHRIELLAADATAFAAPVWQRDGKSLLYWNTKGALVALGRSSRMLIRGKYFDAALSPDGRTVYVLRLNDAVSIPK